MREIIVVSGPPGAGKTSLAVPLARALGLPLLSKDVIKESLYDSLGPEPGDALAWSRRLGAAAMELLWRLAEDFPAAVLEANFRTQSVLERDRLRRLSVRPVEVFCKVPTQLAAERYASRVANGSRHAVHVLEEVHGEFLEQFQQPFGFAAVIEVDTTAPFSTDELVAKVRAEVKVGP